MSGIRLAVVSGEESLCGVLSRDLVVLFVSHLLDLDSSSVTTSRLFNRKLLKRLKLNHEGIYIIQKWKIIFLIY